MGGRGVDVDGVCDLGDVGSLDPGEGFAELAADGVVDEVADLVGGGGVGGGAGAGGDQGLEVGGAELSGVDAVDADRVHLVGGLGDGCGGVSGFRLWVPRWCVSDDDDDLLDPVAPGHVDGLHDAAVDAGIGVAEISSLVRQGA